MMKTYNRELSWLAFNNRVLQEAQDTSVPLMKRLDFLGIFQNNQDEFIKVRLANLIRIIEGKSEDTPKSIDGYTPEELLVLVNEEMQASQDIFDKTLKNVFSEMERNGIYVLNETQLTEEQKSYCRKYFSDEISCWIIPLMLRKSEKMPFLTDNNFYFAVKMNKLAAKKPKYAIIQVPANKTCPRFIKLPSEKGRYDIIFLDDVIRLCLDEIFFMFTYDTISAHAFRFIRDGELTTSDEISISIMEKMEKGIENRLHGDPVRLTYDAGFPKDLLDTLIVKLKLKKEKIQAGGRYQMLRDLMKFPDIRPDLQIINPEPLYHPDIRRFSGVIEVIREKDIFLNFPYHTFNHVIDFLREAAIDNKVKKIFITLYRTAERSKVINALINAAKNGKEVVVLEELMARFDEEQNVENSDLLQKAGVTVIHGFKNLKVHCKLILIERKEKGEMKGFAYVGTGNFNESTAKTYSDFGLLTSNKEIVQDTRQLFDFLMNTHKYSEYKKLLISPYFMRKEFEKMIDTEISNKKNGKEAYIYAKFNTLTDSRIIKQLYDASKAGVDIRLIVRGACSLIPQVKGLSENIKVTSIVDKYLEHTRYFIFCNNKNEKIYISSADWMSRNLDRRIEVAAPVFCKEIKKTIMNVFNIQWSDNVKAREQTILGKNDYLQNGLSDKIRSQSALYDYYKKRFNKK
jgi:polyphosphate kinase